MQGNSHEHKIAMNSTVDLHYKESIIMFPMLSNAKIKYANPL